MAAMKKDKMPISFDISPLVSVLLTFMGGPAIFKILNSIYDIYSKNKVLTHLFKMVTNLKYKFPIFSLILKRLT